MADISPAAWNYDTAAHLLLRAGFGHNGRWSKRHDEATQVSRLANQTPEEAVDKLLTFRASKARGPGSVKTGSQARFDRLQRWWVMRMRRTARPVREKMALFLHVHFATGASTVNKSLHMAVQNALFREYAIGDFRELVKRVNIDPAMLWWLDGRLNKASSINENYGRELQELFTYGVFDFAGERNYSQTDVVEAARILTGWRFREVTSRKLESYFTMSRHDQGSKTIFSPDPAETPNQNPANEYTEAGNTTDESLAGTEHERLIEAIFNHVDTEGRPTAARFIARRLWKFFAYDPVVDASDPLRPDLSLIDDLADEFKNSGYSLRALLRAAFLREEFYADATRTVKNPTEYVVGSLRMLRGKLSGDTRNEIGSRILTNMGQSLFDPPDVFSWRGNLAWITTQTMLKRYEFARDLTEGDKNRFYEIGFRPEVYLDESLTTRQSVVDRFLKILGPLHVDLSTNDELVNWLGADDVDYDLRLQDETYVQIQVRGLVNLILALPLYHVH